MTGLLFVVAEAGLEPRDLRVMSPTSYQLLHSAIFGTKTVVLVTGLEPVRKLLRRILSPLRLPIPPHELAVPNVLDNFITGVHVCQIFFDRYSEKIPRKIPEAGCCAKFYHMILSLQHPRLRAQNPVSCLLRGV